MLLPELKQLASSMGIKGASGMRKGDLIAAIKGQSASQPAIVAENAPQPKRRRAERAAGEPAGAARQAKADQDAPRTEPANPQPAPEAAAERPERPERRRRERMPRPAEAPAADQASSSDEIGARLAALGQAAKDGETRTRDIDDIAAMPRDDESGGSRRNRRRRQRDRQNRRNRGSQGFDRMDAEPTVAEDDVLANISGIVDLMDNYAFVRTSGYLPGPNDAYLSLSTVRRFGLRKGDVITGAVKLPKDGERREKFSPLVRIDSINGDAPENAKNRPEFAKLTPLYPQERLRLETVNTAMTGRIIDLVSPIGKGQRGLIVSPPKAGKTMVMQAIANAITANNPEVHLMVVLVDERPEEVTDFQRTVSGEVIASTFDRPADDHTTISELAIERAKRLVELGRDVVVLLDGITRLGRAYNLAAPASGRILSGGVDSAALYPPKKFFGAARNIENGGSLTILATALIETGSKMDEVIFEEFKGTGNMELRLARQLADKRIFPAIDVDASGTRREELLLGRDELQIIWKLRRALSGLDQQQGLEMLLNRMKKTANNHEFLLSVLKTTPSQD
ncbi:MAG: transcription termination factor Rho [Propionibacteriaceae bacterium]|nr:transcription termination factor Rho [Propionibacteriaceae bacterium]